MLEKKMLTKRFGIVNPLSIKDYIDNGGYISLRKALTMEKITIIDEIENSKLRGRGGAGFPVHIKMLSLAKEVSDVKYLVNNADEGEPGNFKDRALLENDPHLTIEGMIISAYASGATKGYIYIRGEYNRAISIMKWAVDQARDMGYLGENILDSGFDFDIEVRTGAGAYVVGEEFALLESIEGKAGRTRVKPPFPTERGLF